MLFSLSCWAMTILSLDHNLSFYTWNLKNTLIAELLAKTTNPYANLSLNLCNFFPKETPDLSKVTYQMGVQSHPPTSRNPDSEFCGDLKSEKELQEIQFYVFPREQSSGNPVDDKVCNEGHGEYYCAFWGCNSISPWGSNVRFINLKRSSKPTSYTVSICNPLTFIFKQVPHYSWLGEKLGASDSMYLDRILGQAYTSTENKP